MTAITIRHVPEGVRNELAARAASQGQSMQEYLLAELERLAATPDVAQVVLDVRRRKRLLRRELGAELIVADLDADRR